MADLLLKLQCVECKLAIRPPIYCCTKSHIVCSKCESHYGRDGAKIKKTKNCEEGLLKDTFINELIDSLIDYCQFGCGIRTEIGKLREHEDTCGSFPSSSSCQMETCDWKGVYLITHVVNTHPEFVEDGIYSQNKEIELSSIIPEIMHTKFVMLFDQNSRFNYCYWLKYYRDDSKLYIAMIDTDTHRNIDEGKTIYQLKNYLISSSKTEITKYVIKKIAANEKVDVTFLKIYGSDISNLLHDTITIKAPTLKLDTSSTIILDILKCKECGDYMSPVAEICSSGHTVCDKCFDKTQRCQVCDSSVLNVTIEIFQELYKKVKVPCKYNSNGCMENKFNAAGKAIHEKKCIFRDFICPYCANVCMIINIPSHLLDKHVEFKNNSLIDICLNEKSREIIMYEFDKFFIFQMSFENDFKFSLSLLSSTSDSYSYDVKFCNSDFPNQSITFNSLPCSKNFNDRTNWTIPTDVYLKSIHISNNRLRFVITIYKNYVN